MKVLVADDDEATRSLGRALLEALGHEVLEAADGIEAWGRFQREHFGIVLSDWVMPGLDGFELCRRIRAENRTRYTWFILLTAWGGRSNFKEGMEAGADDFLVKPLDGPELAARVHVAERILGLQAHVRQLEGLLPICSYCKRIRDGADWVAVERYVTERTDASFSHSICPRCLETEVKPQLDRFLRGGGE